MTRTMSQHDLDLGSLLAPWTREPPLQPERDFSPWGHPGWTCWNGHAVEFQVADFISRLAHGVATSFSDPYLIETGVGQGFVTRRVIDAIPDTARLICFESDWRWREGIKRFDFWTDHLNACIRNEIFPDEADFRTADLVILDSNDPWRKIEIMMWQELAPDGSVLFVHDTGTIHPPHDGHFTLGFLIKTLGLTGYWLENPRGSFLSQKGRVLPQDRYKALWDSTLEDVYSFE